MQCKATRRERKFFYRSFLVANRLSFCSWIPQHIEYGSAWVCYWAACSWRASLYTEEEEEEEAMRPSSAEWCHRRDGVLWWWKQSLISLIPSGSFSITSIRRIPCLFIIIILFFLISSSYHLLYYCTMRVFIISHLLASCYIARCSWPPCYLDSIQIQTQSRITLFWKFRRQSDCLSFNHEQRRESRAFWIRAWPICD